MGDSSLMMQFILAIFGGILSFLSPCVLPLVPAYLSFLAGHHQTDDASDSVDGSSQLTGDSSGSVRKKHNLVVQATAFVVGFALVFVPMGIAAASVGSVLLKWQGVFTQIAGVVIIVLGIHTLGLFRFSGLMRDIRLSWHGKKFGAFASIIAGMAFAFGWTPCIGPILAGILALAAQTQSASHGAILLTAYTAGLGIPFILTAFGLDRFRTVTKRLKKYFRFIEILSGLLLIGTGILILTGNFTKISSFFIQLMPFLTQFG